MFKQILKAEKLEWLQESLQQKNTGLNAIIKNLENPRYMYHAAHLHKVKVNCQNCLGLWFY